MSRMKTAVNSVCWSRIFLNNFFRVILFLSELRNQLSRKPRNAIPSLFRWIFWERNSAANPTQQWTLSTLFLLPWSFYPISLPSFLCPYTFSLFSLPFCSTFTPVPSSQYPYFSTFFPVNISIPLIFPFIPHTSPILSLTFSYSPSSIRSSRTLHHYALIPFSSSLIHHPLQQQKQLPVNFKKRPQHKP